MKTIVSDSQKQIEEKNKEIEVCFSQIHEFTSMRK
jgi:hypothetical protein